MPTVRTIGAFDLLRPAGAGGMGTVWQARHRGTGRQVGVKVLTAERAREPRFGALFRHEVRAVAALDHPRIITVLDHGVVPEGVPDVPAESPYLAMEWAGGGSLFNRLPLVRWAEARRVLLALLDALAHAHAHGVLHRDLKPGNVLHVGGPDADWKLADFGIARVLADPADRESVGPAAGTPTYMAPEQARGADHELGPWTDLYGVGCVAWELVTGAPPWSGEAGEVRRAHVFAPLPPLRVDFDVPEGLTGWLHRLLAKDPEDRFLFAADARHALLALEAHPHRHPPEESFDLLAADEPTDTPPLAADWRPEPVSRGALPANTGLGLLGLRPVPLVGRAEERDALWAALHGVVTDGAARGVALLGPSGLGKSRLAAWIGSRAHAAGAARWVHVSHAATDGPEDGVEAALGRLLRREVPRDAVSAPERAGRLLPLCEAATRRRPLVMWIDDVAWSADDLALLLHLSRARALPAHVLFVLTAADDALTSRPAAATTLDQLLTEPAFTRVPLLPLDDGDRARLVEGILGLSPGLAAEVSERTGGNPLFAVQLVRSWTERGLLRPGPVGYTLSAELEVPQDLSAVWRERIAALVADVEPAGVHALEIAAVLGLRVSMVEWRDACHASRVDPRPDLVERLAHARLATTEPGAFSFTHALFREALVVRAGDRARTWNAACARMLAANDGDPERVGRHRLAAGDPAAVEPLLEAARRRRRAGDLGHALALVEDGLDALQAAGAPPDDERWGLLRDEQVEALRMRGDLPQADAVASQNLAAARTHRWRRVRARTLFNRAEIARAQGRYDDAVSLAQTAVDAERALGPAGRIWTPLSSLAMGYRARLELDRAWETAAEAVAAARQNGDPHPLALALLTQATIASDRGANAEARAICAESITWSDREGGRMLRAGALLTLGNLDLDAGDHAAAEANYARATEAFRRCGHAHASLAELSRARALLRLRRIPEARAALHSAASAPGGASTPSMICFYEMLHATLFAGESTAAEFAAHLDRCDAELQRLGVPSPDLAESAEEAAAWCLELGLPERAAACRARAIAWRGR